MTTRPADCPFCRIVNGSDAEAQVVGQADDWVAFFPLHPATTGHTLVVPRAHVRDYWELDAETAASLAVACVDVGRALTTVLAPQGMNLITSSGEVAEQTVFHVHLHVVPRWAGDDIDRIWPTTDRSSERASNDLVTEVARALAAVQGD